MHVLRTYPAHETPARDNEPIVITGIGMITSVGRDRESVWRAVQQGRSGVRRLHGLQGIPDGMLIGAPVDIEPEVRGQVKNVPLSLHAAAEALADARINWGAVDPTRFGCGVSVPGGATSGIAARGGRHELVDPQAMPWWQQWLGNEACAQVANRFGLCGPRLTHSTACASGLVEILMAYRTLRDDQCDMA